MIRVNIPVLDEEAAIGTVSRDIPKAVSEVIVVDNVCRDGKEIRLATGRSGPHLGHADLVAGGP